MLDKATRVIAGLFGLMMFAMGLRWLVDPSGAAAGIGMPVLDGLARSSQIGDLGAFFIVSGGFALLGVIKRNAALLYAPAALVGVAALFRLLAWLVQGAAFAPEFIVFELIMCAVFLFARYRLAMAGH